MRAPEGCPWDREQTHESLRRYLLEETYEVLEALDNADPAALREELGDLLLQVVLHAQIAIESEEFQAPQVPGRIMSSTEDGFKVGIDDKGDRNRFVPVAKFHCFLFGHAKR